jgi:glucose/arabinose dehydrogenase
MLPLILTPKAPATPSVDQLPDPSTAQFKLFTGGLTHPVQVSGVPDGSGRVFILEKAGLIRIVKNGQLLDTPFLDIRDRVGSQNTEQGLLGLAFHPDFPKQNFFYLNYTNPSGNSVVSSFQVSSNPDQADPNSETILFTVDQPYANHNGGSMEIGPEGYLYIGFGDGGSEGDPLDNGQSLQTHLGKILRIDISGGNSYTIPPDNPFVNGGGLPEIWEYGLRNPWRFSFDMQTGDMYIADVGQNKWEEVDYVPAKTQGGLNFGWSYYEGDHPYKGTPPQNETFVFPVHEYSHSEGCSISGGSVYRGQDLPDWQGVYLYGDYCLGKVWGLLRHSNGAWENKLMYQMNANITHVGTDAQGEIYLADYQGSVYRLEKP